MSTVLIIVGAAIILVALVAFMLPRMQRKRALAQRRERIADEHRAEAGERHQEADEAERQARMAKREARQVRVEAESHEQRAEEIEQGVGDEPTPLRDDQPMHEPAEPGQPGRFTPAAERADEPAARRD